MKTKMNKTDKHSSQLGGNPLLDELISEISPVEMEQTRVKMHLSARIADAIRDKGWNNKTFAAKLEKKPSEITKWLSGTHNFTVNTLVEICQVLGIQLSVLIEKRPMQTVFRKHLEVNSVGVGFVLASASTEDTRANEVRAMLLRATSESSDKNKTSYVPLSYSLS